MNLIIDPLLFWLPENPTDEDVKSALAFVDETISISREGYSLICSDPLWSKIITHNYRKLSNFTRSHVLHSMLRELQSRVRMVQWQVQKTETEGIRDLIHFANVPDQVSWMTDVSQIVAYSVNKEEEYYLMTRLFLGRNLKMRPSMQHCCILEKTHWQVFLSLDIGNGMQEYSISCISSLRNLLVPWTMRHDDLLPDTAPNNGLAFVPNARWTDRMVKVIETANSKICWIDGSGNAWSDTNTPGDAYHWDVFPSPKGPAAKFGKHVNITRHGTDDRNRAPGQIHH